MPDKFKRMADARRIGMSEWNNDGDAWKATPPKLRQLIDRYNQAPAAVQESVLRQLTEPAKAAPVRAMMLEQAKVMRNLDRGGWGWAGELLGQLGLQRGQRHSEIVHAVRVDAVVHPCRKRGDGPAEVAAGHVGVVAVEIVKVHSGKSCWRSSVVSGVAGPHLPRARLVIARGRVLDQPGLRRSASTSP